MTLRDKLRFLRLDIEFRVDAVGKVLTQSCVKIKIKASLVQSSVGATTCRSQKGSF
jgi:hypothetical protein